MTDEKQAELFESGPKTLTDILGTVEKYYFIERGYRTTFIVRVSDIPKLESLIHIIPASFTFSKNKLPYKIDKDDLHKSMSIKIINSNEIMIEE